VLEGALILLAGIIIGRLLPGRRRKAAAKASKPVCGCTHHHAYHDAKTGQCHGMVREATHFTMLGAEIAWRQVQCTCRRYSGPEPLPEYFATEIGSAGA
jgi:hypothetical protein